MNVRDSFAELGCRAPRLGRAYRPSSVTAHVESLERRCLLAVQVGPISIVAGQPFSGQVATFSPADLQGNAPVSATISWGGGLAVITSGTISPDGLGGYIVKGSNT